MLKAMIKPLLVVTIILMLVILIIKAVFFYQDETDLLIREVSIEAGTQRPGIDLFFREEPAFPDLVSTNLDFDEVNINLPQTINFNIKMYGRNFPCKLFILDTTAPKGEGIPQKMFSCDEIPDAASCVTGIEDVTAANAAPDWSMPVYSITGQQVNRSYKGVVIQNNRKYMLY